jgi:ureidoglycolate lyase
LKLHAQTLSADEFSEFGDVIEHHGTERRHPFAMGADEGMPQAYWVTKVSSAISFPFEIDQLEYHPHSDQAFFPLSGQRMLIVVCPSLDGGGPDVSKAKAFVSKPGQGILYRQNVWHAGMSVLDLPAQFVVTMAMGRDAQNDVFLKLTQPLNVEFLECS